MMKASTKPEAAPTAKRPVVASDEQLAAAHTALDAIADDHPTGARAVEGILRLAVACCRWHAFRAGALRLEALRLDLEAVAAKHGVTLP